MKKHRGFPSRLSGTDHHFTIRRAAKGSPTAITRRERYRDRRAVDRKADSTFLTALVQQFGDEPFERGNLDAGRLSWLFGREVVPAEDPFDPASYDALLRVDFAKAQVSFPEAFEADLPPEPEDDEPW